MSQSLEELAIRVNDVVQLNPELGDMFGGCFAVVTEVKLWGIQGYVSIPGKEGAAYVRVSHDQYERIGHAVWIEKSDANLEGI